jgi:DHA3 family macrolide efflux protein-like MFS transporter
MSAGGIGGVIGSIILTVWGGPKRKVHGVLIGWAVVQLGSMMMGLGSVITAWVSIFFLSMLINPIINISNQSIWQSKVAPDLQGRVL